MTDHSCPPHLLKGLSPEHRKKVLGAFHFAQEHLGAVPRRTHASYARHGVLVALTLREISADPTLLSVAILHDIYLFKNAPERLRLSVLTREERLLARKMHELRRLHIDAHTKDLDRVIAAFSGDERLLILRMAHRLNDVRQLDRFDPPLQKMIAQETLHMYTSIAGRLGMHAWRHEMEDVCFRFLHPKAARGIERKMQAARALDLVCIRHAKNFLRRKFRAEGIRLRLSYRIKGLYSTYRKMVIKDRSFEELTDRLAVRIIVPDLQDCYRALGLVHAAFHPIPGKLKDYIGAPKENGYRSIHTVVNPLAGVTEQPMEIQIRTEEMHDECEFGIARHVDYKHTLYALHDGSTRVQLFRNLEGLRQVTRSPRQFEKALRTYYDGSHIALFDAANTLYHLPKPATALDFVCHVFGKRVSKLHSIRINGRAQPPGMQLKDGDTVEALFGSVKTVDAAWIDWCRYASSRALLETLI